MQNAANKYGWDSFIFRVIETCSSSELVTLEQSYLDMARQGKTHTFNEIIDFINVCAFALRGFIFWFAFLFFLHLYYLEQL